MVKWSKVKVTARPQMFGQISTQRCSFSPISGMSGHIFMKLITVTHYHVHMKLMTFQGHGYKGHGYRNFSGGRVPVDDSQSKTIYTARQKKTAPFYFCNNFVRSFYI